jgi:ABC-type spermidine/putrescine transport system permease subunit II
MTRRSLPWAVVTGAILVFLFAPVALVLLFSFNSGATVSPPFEGFSLKWYTSLFSREDYRTGMEHSAAVAAFTVAISTTLGTLAALGLQRVGRRLRAAVGALMVLPLIIPWLFTGIALLVFFSRAGIELSMLTIVIGHVVVTVPLVTLIVSARLARLDPSVLEAARDLGASGAQAFRKTTLPQIAPALIGSAFLVAASSIDEFVITLFINGGVQTVPIVIYSSLRTGIGPEVNAVASLMIVITFTLTLIASRFVATNDLAR